jgi:hypothetical protein
LPSPQPRRSATKANVVGPISRYREYIQVPDIDDAADGSTVDGQVGRWTSALSTIPYSKHVYDTVPYFMSNGKLGADAVFYRPDTDYVFNVDTSIKLHGDAARQITDHPGDPYYTNDAYRPNVTFLNVYTGTNAAVQSARPGQVLLFEHSYMSTASRNDYDRRVLNAVDVFVDGGNSVAADAVIPRPSISNLFVNDPQSPYYTGNYRRWGYAELRPIAGNLFTPLFFQPVIDVPDIIEVGGVNYYRDLHYWLVRDVSDLHGTVRARNGIEWDRYLRGQAAEDDADDPSAYSGPTIVYGDDVSETGESPALTVTGYRYDKNINDLQAALDGNKQVTTDVLGHQARRRYFKLDVTVMYTPGANVGAANQAIRDAIAGFFKDQYFGATVQLSDILQTIHNVPQVDNVRFSRDLPYQSGEIGPYNRVIEVNNDGTDIGQPVIQRVVLGSASVREQLLMYLPERLTTGTVMLSGSGGTGTFTVADMTASSVQAVARATASDSFLTVVGTGRAADPFVITYSGAGVRAALTGKASSAAAFNTDFFLKDDELPALPDGQQTGDSVPGLIIRPRAQNTWTRVSYA